MFVSDFVELDNTYKEVTVVAKVFESILSLSGSTYTNLAAMLWMRHSVHLPIIWFTHVFYLGTKFCC